jgi:hypothetical protein
MDQREKEYDARHREASRAGLLVGIFFLILAIRSYHRALAGR